MAHRAQELALGLSVRGLRGAFRGRFGVAVWWGWLAALALGCAWGQPPSGGETPPVLSAGLDVSGHSGAVDWETVVAGGHTFAFVKATEGVDLKDPAFDAHWQAMRAAGLRRGAYHFYVTEDDPREQARFFIDSVALEPGDLVPVVDVELLGRGTTSGLAARLKVWLDEVEGHYGAKPIIYTSPRFWNANLSGDFGSYPLWIAEYEVAAPSLPAGWAEWHLWQYRGDADVAGVEKGADLSRVNGAGADLSVLILPNRGETTP